MRIEIKGALKYFILNNATVGTIRKCKDKLNDDVFYQGYLGLYNIAQERLPLFEHEKEVFVISVVKAAIQNMLDLREIYNHTKR